MGRRGAGWCEAERCTGAPCGGVARRWTLTGEGAGAEPAADRGAAGSPPAGGAGSGEEAGVAAAWGGGPVGCAVSGRADGRGRGGASARAVGLTGGRAALARDEGRADAGASVRDEGAAGGRALVRDGGLTGGGVSVRDEGLARGVASAGALVTGAPSGERRRAITGGALRFLGVAVVEREVGAGGVGFVGADCVWGRGVPVGWAELPGVRGAPAVVGGTAVDGAGVGVAETGAPRPVAATVRVTLRCTGRWGADRAGAGSGGGFGTERDAADGPGPTAGEGAEAGRAGGRPGAGCGASELVAEGAVGTVWPSATGSGRAP